MSVVARARQWPSKHVSAASCFVVPISRPGALVNIAWGAKISHRGRHGDEVPRIEL